MNNETFIVHGSYGELTVGIQTGQIYNYSPNSDYDSDYSNIIEIDIKEWESTYNTKITCEDKIDILDVGYWWLAPNDERIYEEPANDWRKETKRL